MNRKHQALTTALAVCFALTAAQAEAKRVGSSSRSSSSSSTVSKPKADDAKPEEPRRDINVNVVPSIRYSAAGAAAGAVAGSAAAKAVAESDAAKAQAAEAEAAAAELSRMEREDNIKSKARAEELARIAEEAVKTAEAKFKAEQAAKLAEERRREEEAEAKRRAAEERREELKRLAIEREKSCVIKPTMTDAEIDHCKQVWSYPRPQM